MLVHFGTRIYCAFFCFRRRELTCTFTWIRWLEWSSVFYIFFLKFVSSPIDLFFEFLWTRCGSAIKLLVTFRNILVPFHYGSMFASGGFLHHCKALVMVICVALSMIHVSVSVANNFVHSFTAADQGYHSFGEMARFVYCLLQKTIRRDAVAFSKSLWIVSCQPLLWDPSLDRDWAVSALSLWLVGMTLLPSNFLLGSWMGYWRGVGRGGAKLRRAGLSTSLCAGTTAAGAVVHEKTPWPRWRPVILFCTGWLPLSSAPV